MKGQKKEPPEANSLRADIGFLLEKLDVFCLEALGPLDHVKLHRLAFLKAAESIRLYGREMHENIVAGLTAKKAIALGVVKPLYCSLFQFVTCFYFEFLLRRIAAGERAERYSGTDYQLRVNQTKLIITRCGQPGNDSSRT
jgi:hypothetical protein